MTADLAIEYIARRMAELCREDYHLRFRHLRLQPGEQRNLAAHTDLFLLVEPPASVRVESDVGIFDTSEDGANELQYEHQGNIQVTNLSVFASHVRFIQVIPKAN
ncbi:hypothetical protein [Puia dinghuensis]|uniref:Uncharacterized protein n=1 Tax=Puia dinghuensis TaxID=1792502 RepID=A0A8J2UA73_9BACT|nr:hypothetical protein [Puia dinghuensis]GGA89959.1 hypothetical protein GCM10011511_11510 [Puia dinghuensis]